MFHYKFNLERLLNPFCLMKKKQTQEMDLGFGGFGDLGIFATE